MNYARVCELFSRSIDTGNPDAMFQAAPDSRLVHPVGGYGFPLREFAPSHAFEVSWSLACSGLRPVGGVLN